MTPFWQHVQDEARKHLQRALNEHDTVAEAAKALQLDRTHLYGIMHRLGMRPNRRNRGNAAWRSLG